MAKKKKAAAKKSGKLSGKQLDKITGGEGMILCSDGLKKPDEVGLLATDDVGLLATDEVGLMKPDRGLLKRHR